MDIFREIIECFVAFIGVISWIVFLPQIRLLIKVKEAKSNSLGMIWGSFVMQSVLCTHTILRHDWHMTFVMTMSLIGNATILILIYYYRKYPGGRSGV